MHCLRNFLFHGQDVPTNGSSFNSHMTKNRLCLNPHIFCLVCDGGWSGDVAGWGVLFVTGVGIGEGWCETSDMFYLLFRALSQSVSDTTPHNFYRF